MFALCFSAFLIPLCVWPQGYILHLCEIVYSGGYNSIQTLKLELYAVTMTAAELPGAVRVYRHQAVSLIEC